MVNICNFKSLFLYLCNFIGLFNVNRYNVYRVCIINIFSRAYTLLDIVK